MSTVQGTCSPQFSTLRTIFQQNLDSEVELGASIAVNLDGVEVADLWGGFTDISRTQPWKEDTIVNVWSSTKCATSLVVLKLVDSGVLSINDKVSKYWPEFAANGKEDVEIRHLLSHSSGLSGWEEPITHEQVCDFEYAAGKLAEQKPWWTPGAASGYHAMTFGNLLGMVVRRALGGRTLKEYLAEEIAAPLEADFQIGALEKDWPRISNVIPPPSTKDAIGNGPHPPFMMKTFLNPVPNAEFSNTSMWRLAEKGDSNGHGNAKGMNRMFSAISLGGTARGKKILSPETVDLIFQEQVKGTDLVLGKEVRLGVGYGLRGTGDDGSVTPVDDFVPPGRICFWGGWGGSIVIMDLDRRLTITYAMNKMSDTGMGNGSGRSYVRAIYKALGVI
ncbi:beta-lactamase [Pseudomassariella vexata]|uniref:Beta-lactamase n=1 Tax=Pseudomassariella vexata TaxID=1141098 RepID=A0A1Y2DG10_9PEZI|nr:beta-lactamase [Pseudomassariella vexata]ORY58137.1 beta-lactamase [Pseudomassariella vexata]